MTSLITAAFVVLVVGAIAGVIGGWVLRGMAERPLHIANTERHAEVKALAGQWERLAVEKIAVIEKMRQDGFSVQRPAKITEPVDPESEGLRRAEGEVILRKRQREFITRAKADIMKSNPGTNAHDAEKEARRLLSEAEMEDPPG